MLEIDPDTGEETYDFPVKLYNTTGGEYQVDNLEALKFHLLNGWYIVPPEQETPAPPVDTGAHLSQQDAELRGLRERVATVEAALDVLEKKYNAMNGSLVKAHLKLAKLLKEEEKA
jgi:hypothetical protein